MSLRENDLNLSLMVTWPTPGEESALASGHLLMGSGKREIKVRQSCSFSFIVCDRVLAVWENLCILLWCFNYLVWKTPVQGQDQGSTNYFVGLTQARNPWRVPKEAWVGSLHPSPEVVSYLYNLTFDILFYF